MSYPPNPYAEQDGHEGMLNDHGASGSGSLSAPDLREGEEEELNAVRRYEDFTTVGKLISTGTGGTDSLRGPDWIQDSLHERNLRSKGPMRRSPLLARLDNMEGFFGYVWRLVNQALEEGESWVVLSLVGTVFLYSGSMLEGEEAEANLTQVSELGSVRHSFQS